MTRPVRVGLALLGIFLVSVPASVVATILLLPLWSWVEASLGIESVGHSGPAEWCYAVTFFLFVAVGAVVLLAHERAKSKPSV
jgi:hypothetical protein